MQVKLLRLLQDRQYERLGGTSSLTADVRFIAATHRDLEHMVKKGEFREDLFYRLNVVPIWLPPLRARRSDVVELATRFCDTFAHRHGKAGATLSPEALDALGRERWPGNVRQLQNFVERLVVLADSPLIGAADVARELAPEHTFPTDGAAGTAAAPSASLASPSGLTFASRTGPIVPLDATLRAAERSAIVRALSHVKGNRASQPVSSEWDAQRSTRRSPSSASSDPEGHAARRRRRGLARVRDAGERQDANRGGAVSRAYSCGISRKTASSTRRRVREMSARHERHGKCLGIEVSTALAPESSAQPSCDENAKDECPACRTGVVPL